MKTATYSVPTTINGNAITAERMKWLRKRFRQTVRRHCHKVNANWNQTDKDYTVTYADKSVKVFSFTEFLSNRYPELTTTDKEETETNEAE